MYKQTNKEGEYGLFLVNLRSFFVTTVLSSKSSRAIFLVFLSRNSPRISTKLINYTSWLPFSSSVWKWKHSPVSPGIVSIPPRSLKLFKQIKLPVNSYMLKNNRGNLRKLHTISTTKGAVCVLCPTSLTLKICTRPSVGNSLPFLPSMCFSVS